MRIFLTGGTGFVGREVLRRLHEAGHATRMLVRSSARDKLRQLAARHGAELVAGSLEDPAVMEQALRGCEAAIHLVGIINETGGATFQSIHVEGTAAVLAAAREAGVQRFVHMSALGTRAGARSRYHQTKWQAEELVRASGLEWTIFRPSVIYGREDGFVNLLAAVTRWSPLIPLFGGGRNRLQPIAVELVAECFVKALTEPRAIGRTFDLCGREVFTLRQIYDCILQATRRRRPKATVPMAIARLQASIMQAVFGLAGRPSPLTRDQLLMLEEDNCGDPVPAEELFGLATRSFAEGIARYLR